MKNKRIVIDNVIVGHGPGSDLQTMIARVFRSPPYGQGSMTKLSDYRIPAWGATSLEQQI